MITPNKVNPATSFLGKHAPATAMIRLVREMRDQMEEAGLLTPEDIISIDNIVYPFLATQPQKVKDEVREG